MKMNIFRTILALVIAAVSFGSLTGCVSPDAPVLNQYEKPGISRERLRDIRH